MPVFDVARRESIMDYIVSIMNENEHIVSLIAVGSGAYGYNDELSDLDMVVATDSNENTAAVKKYVAERLNEKLKFIYFKQPEFVPLQVYLTDDFLEIDIGFGAYTSAAAFKPHWKVLFDKSGTVDEAMRKSWDSIKNAPKTDEYKKKLSECADVVWHSLMNVAVAVKRGDFWRANAELDAARNMLIAMLGIRFSVDTDRGKEVDKLPESELAALKRTVPSGFSANELRNSLDALTDAVYTELERFGEGVTIQVNREQVMEYINACKRLN